MAAADDAQSLSFADAAAWAEVVLLTVPFAAAHDVIDAAGGLAHKIVIDCTNAVAVDEDGPKLALDGETSAGEQIAAWAPEAQVFKSFNQLGLEALGGATDFAGHPPFMLVAGPDTDARKTIMQLVHDAGFDGQYIGGIQQSRLLEAFAMVWIHLAGTKRTGRDWALKRIKLEKVND
ncbi:NAD(P)-binding domain-containing protein [uncultured Roseobacter sp.]|uniref:NADPH-dependent F420 reductase n=1 Tax=uncultured Roseobacter sp. TaxID=114847 RepID=UPI0026159326|nr:NAD(P)-binding domain-containing protein [uncultured Roseobacter sp.]